MLKIIGFIVVIAVILIGFGPLQKWYTGDATPQETVNEIRQRVGESVAGNTAKAEKTVAEETVELTEPEPPSPEQAPPINQEQDKPLTAESILKDMMKDN